MPYTIWKHTLFLGVAVIEIEMPVGSDIVAAREQGNSEIALWYRCNPELPMVTRRFVVVPTGGVCPDSIDGHYLGIASLDNGTYIFHIFELFTHSETQKPKELS